MFDIDKLCKKFKALGLSDYKSGSFKKGGDGFEGPIIFLYFEINHIIEFEWIRDHANIEFEFVVIHVVRLEIEVTEIPTNFRFDCLSIQSCRRMLA